MGCPTGVAALNVGGMTLHSLFGISTNSKSFKPRYVAAKQEKFKNTKVLIMYEKSMMGLKLFGLKFKAANHYFNDAKTLTNFGKILAVLVIDDHAQLPPVLDKPL